MAKPEKTKCTWMHHKYVTVSTEAVDEQTAVLTQVCTFCKAPRMKSVKIEELDKGEEE